MSGGQGSYDYDSSYASLGQFATPCTVYRFLDTLTGDARWQIMPNVVCDSIQVRAGATAPVARFRYLLDDLIAASEGWPTQFDDIWPLDAQGRYVFGVDDRVVVYAVTPYGAERVLFDGHCQIPQVDIEPSGQSVTFVATGVAQRLWDLPIGGRVQRGADDPNAGAAIQTDLPTRFNPRDGDGKERKNCTPADWDEQRTDPATAYPVFLDDAIERTTDPRRAWTLSGAVRYLLAVHNDERYVTNPDFTDLDEILKSQSPDVGGIYDLDGSDFTAEDILVRDYDATNKPWPVAVGELLRYAGFDLRFVTTQDDAGDPVNRIEIYRTDADRDREPKTVWLDEQGATLDPARNSVQGLHMARDLNSVVNAFSVETPPRKVEISVVLAPGFLIASGDASDANRPTYLSGRLKDATKEVRRKYRQYVADEAGDGHWSYTHSAWRDSESFTDSTLDLSPVFPDEDGAATYVKRLRPGKQKVITTDSAGVARKARLSYSTDYVGVSPSVWDGSGTWEDIPDSQWRLLPDRLGIEFNKENPEAIGLGEGKGALRGITAQAAPTTEIPQFFLRLTTVIDDDIMLAAVTSKRDASPTIFNRRRRIDARDHFEKWDVHSSSPWFTGTSDEDLVSIRDDTEKALAHARALQSANEFPPLAGSITIPGIVNAYEVGDRISTISGREITLRANTNISQGESEAYPIVVSVAWSFSGVQMTTLQLSDRRAEVAKA
jgi:hypothetical protein